MKKETMRLKRYTHYFSRSEEGEFEEKQFGGSWAGQKAVAEKLVPGLAKMGKRAVRATTNPAAMKNASYAKDMGLTSRKDLLNLKITNKMPNLADSWSGKHGTTLGNAKKGLGL